MRFPEVIEGSTAPARMKLESSSSSSSGGGGSIGICASSSRTCEAAMSQGTGRGFVSVMHLLDSCSVSKAAAGGVV
jgi:hypothetical protein